MSQQLPPEVLNLIDSALTEDQAFNGQPTAWCPTLVARVRSWPGYA